ncbi:MAG: ABC transporter permease [Dokdonella sp.]|uniref:ABC transporter permease n=1 Tax=Dokdonella sp. TaxID=2291710 RepID=UPI003263A630
MNTMLVHAFHSEWLKKKNSLAVWLVLCGSLFTPAIVTLARLIQHNGLEPLYRSDDFWHSLWRSSWESMAIFLLPVCAILATSLLTQIEYHNNAWKQVRTLPLPSAHLFVSKLAVVFLMLVQFFALFNVGIWLSAMVPCVLLSGVPFPTQPIPLMDFLQDDARYFVDCLPIVALQYALGLRFGNFLVSVGAGFLLWVGALAALSWKYGFLVPYTYVMFDYLKQVPAGKTVRPDMDIHVFALGYFVAFIALGFAMFASRRQKG